MRFQNAILSLICLVPMTAATEPLTLERAYQAALTNAEKIAISQESVAFAEAEYRRRIGIAIPGLSLRATEFIQDVPGGTTGAPGSIQNTFVRRDRPEVALQFNYILFSGLREFAGLASSKATLRQREDEYKRARQLLYLDVSNAYLAIVQRQNSIEILTAARDVLADRMKELARFEKLGRSRASERVSVEADKLTTEANIDGLLGELETYRSIFAFVTGIQPPPEVVPENSDPSPPPSLEVCLEDLKARPDVIALHHATLSAEKQVMFARGAYYPLVDVGANYYPYRVGFQEDIDWDVQFTLSWAFFRGGQTVSEVDQAEALFQQARLALHQVERQARSEIETRHAQTTSTIARYISLRRAAEAHEKNYRLQSQEYRLGLVTNLEVLTALYDLYRTKVDLEAVRVNAKTQTAELAVARGNVPGSQP